MSPAKSYSRMMPMSKLLALHKHSLNRILVLMKSDQKELARREHLQNTLQVRTFYDACAFADKTFQATGSRCSQLLQSGESVSSCRAAKEVMRLFGTAQSMKLSSMIRVESKVCTIVEQLLTWC